MNSTEYKALQLKRAKARDATIRYNPPFKLEGWGPATMRWIEHASDGLRVREAKTGGFREPVGYYVDHFFDETTVPYVLQLPAAPVKGVRCERYMAATSDPYNPDCYLTDGDIVDNMHDAIRWAHRLAERYAETCREDDAKFQAQQQIEQAKEYICGYRAEASRLVEELRRARSIAGDIPLIVNAARKQIAQLRSRVAEEHKRIKRLTDNYWYAVQL